MCSVGERARIVEDLQNILVVEKVSCSGAFDRRKQLSWVHVHRHFEHFGLTSCPGRAVLKVRLVAAVVRPLVEILAGIFLHRPPWHADCTKGASS